MVAGPAASTTALAATNACAWTVGERLGACTRKAVWAGLGIGLVSCGAFATWYAVAHRRFSYEGTVKRVCVPEGVTCLDIGCGSGTLSIAMAKRSPDASVVGVDFWGPEYASFSKDLCESNESAESVSNAHFEFSDARSLPFPDGFFNAITSNYVYHNIVGSNKQELLRETLRRLERAECSASTIS